MNSGETHAGTSVLRDAWQGEYVEWAELCARQNQDVDTRDLSGKAGAVLELILEVESSLHPAVINSTGVQTDCSCWLKLSCWRSVFVFIGAEVDAMDWLGGYHVQ